MSFYQGPPLRSIWILMKALRLKKVLNDLKAPGPTLRGIDRAHAGKRGGFGAIPMAIFLNNELWEFGKSVLPCKPLSHLEKQGVDCMGSKGEADWCHEGWKTFPGPRSQLHQDELHVSYASDSAFLCFRFPIWKMGIIVVRDSRRFYKDSVS